MEGLSMKKIGFVVVLLVTMASLCGCRHKTHRQIRNTFTTDFSLNTVIENNERFLLDQSHRMSGSESGFQEPFIQSHQEIIIQIDPVNVPDFMMAVSSDIEEALIKSDACILGREDGSNTDIVHFSFSYSENEVRGTIHVWGIHGEATNYTIIVLITEHST
jgi:hypothetical protein